jgi:hypothetical protein
MKGAQLPYELRVPSAPPLVLSFSFKQTLVLREVGPEPFDICDCLLICLTQCRHDNTG